MEFLLIQIKEYHLCLPGHIVFFFFFIFTIILIIRWHVYYYLTHEVENVGIKTHSNMPVAGIFGA